MERTRIKICGVTRRQDIEALNGRMPDYCGFVFYPESKRYIDWEQAARLRGLLNPEVTTVGVFVNEGRDQILSLVRDGIIQVIQLHGQEDEEYIQKLKTYTSAPIIKAFLIQEEADLVAARNSSADYVLLDNGYGTGKTFNWDLLPEEGIGRPYFLAGGLGADNLTEAIAKYHPYAVDLSSSVETNGKKDPAKIARVVSLVRRAEAFG